MADRMEQRKNIVMPISLLVLVLSSVVGYAIMTKDFKFPTDMTLFSKLVFALRWQILPLTTLVFSIMRVGFARGSRDALDPLDPDAQKRIEPFSRRLQNTLEQLILSFISQLVLSTFLEPETLWIIPLLALTFFTGRILFFLGYPEQRTLGFLITYLPTVVTILADIVFLVKSGFIKRKDFPGIFAIFQGFSVFFLDLLAYDVESYVYTTIHSLLLWIMYLRKLSLDGAVVAVQFTLHRYSIRS